MDTAFGTPWARHVNADKILVQNSALDHLATLPMGHIIWFREPLTQTSIVAGLVACCAISPHGCWTATGAV